MILDSHNTPEIRLCILLEYCKNPGNYHLSWNTPRKGMEFYLQFSSIVHQFVENTQNVMLSSRMSLITS